MFWAGVLRKYVRKLKVKFLSVCRIIFYGYPVMKPEERVPSNGDRVDSIFCFEDSFIEIKIQNPTSEVDNRKEKYTLYEIVIKTDDASFTLTESNVKRRYSEFIWLKSALRNIYPGRPLPELPPKRPFHNRFDPHLIEFRRRGLEQFLVSVMSDQIFLSAKCFHLFLQTKFTTDEIQMNADGLRDDMIICYDSSGELSDKSNRTNSMSSSEDSAIGTLNHSLQSKDDVNLPSTSGYNQCLPSTSTAIDCQPSTSGMNQFK